MGAGLWATKQGVARTVAATRSALLWEHRGLDAGKPRNPDEEAK